MLFTVICRCSFPDNSPFKLSTNGLSGTRGINQNQRFPRVISNTNHWMNETESMFLIKNNNQEKINIIFVEIQPPVRLCQLVTSQQKEQPTYIQKNCTCLQNVFQNTFSESDLELLLRGLHRSPPHPPPCPGRNTHFHSDKSTLLVLHWFKCLQIARLNLGRGEA